MSTGRIYRIVCRDCDEMIEFVACETLAPLGAVLSITFNDDEERDRVESWPHHDHTVDIFACDVKGSA